MAQPDDDVHRLGHRFWADERVQAVLDDMAAEQSAAGQPGLERLLRFRALYGAEVAVRAQGEEAVSELRRNSDLTWAQIAEAVGLSLSATMQRYNRQYRQSNAKRQRRHRER